MFNYIQFFNGVGIFNMLILLLKRGGVTLKIYRVLFLMVAMALLVFTIPKAYVPADSRAEIPATEKYVALTFDDGPRADTTARLLDGLRDRDAKATFFLVGRQITSNVTLVQRMKAEGHQIGNHTWDHLKLQGASASVVTEEISKTDTVLRNLLGDDDYWVRTPFGKIDQCQEKLFTVPLVKWSVDPWDWKLKNVDKDVAAVLKQVKPGDIILMHDTVPESVDAALRIVDTLQSKGYKFVTVKELLEKNGVAPQPGVMYYSDKRHS